MTIHELAGKFGYRDPRRYEARSRFLFKDVPLNGKRMLEVGCGMGAFSIWAALEGAEYVLGIEPEAQGSTTGTSRVSMELVEQYKWKNVEFKPTFLEELVVPQEEEKFDVMLMYNVINHLDEANVERVHTDARAYESYENKIGDLKQYLKKGAVIIVADCGRRNAWNMLGLKSPFAPTIEWNKHQNPTTWIRLFKDAGFELIDCRWSPLYPLGRLSQSWLVHFLTSSHFALRFRCL
jgi:cyclopropane fatty-acyl-phospholipid synthase-like methyltransferase